MEIISDTVRVLTRHGIVVTTVSEDSNTRDIVSFVVASICYGASGVVIIGKGPACSKVYSVAVVFRYGNVRCRCTDDSGRTTDEVCREVRIEKMYMSDVVSCIAYIYVPPTNEHQGTTETKQTKTAWPK